MSNLTYIELRPGRVMPTPHEQLGVELGRDYARYGLWLPAPYGQEPSPLRQGQLAGEATFGSRTLQPTRHVRQWLQLRLHAWLRGRSVELFQVTPNYLQQIEVTHCPVTRDLLSSATLGATDASIDRLRNDAGYAAGNLALMSRRANHAKGANGYRAALQLVAKITAEKAPGFAGLDALQWSRVAVLCSFVEAVPHEEAATLPLLVLPPNRVRLFNPVQALQALVSRQLLTAGWSRRLEHPRQKSHEEPLKLDFKRFFMAFLPRVLEAGKLGDDQATRWAIEDAWQSPLVQQRWVEFASQLTAARCESLLAKAESHRLANVTMLPMVDDAATDGWNLATRGYVPPTPSWASSAGASAPASAQQQLAW